MKNLITTLKSLAASKSGATAIEYALLAGLIAAVMVAGVTTLGTNIAAEFTAISSNF